MMLSQASHFEWKPQNWRKWIETDSLSRGQYDDLTATVLDSFQRGDVGLVLDAGCGYGRVSSRLLQRHPEITIVGVDASRAMIESSSELERTGRFSAVLGAMENLPFRSDSFDSIICFGVMMHVRDDRRALHELTRVLKPGGRIVLSFLNRLNPFSVPFTINAKIGKLSGFRLNFRLPRYFVQSLRKLGFNVRILHPGFLVPGEIWLLKIPALGGAFKMLSVKVKGSFGYEPVLEALQ